MNKTLFALNTLFVSLMLLNMANCELRFLFSMFRHGARSPVGLDEKKKDDFGEYWANPGELTPVGMRMHYMLGLRNRDNYGKFIPKTWDTSIFIRSSDYNRTMQSVQSQLQGFFEAGNGHKLTKFQKKTAFAINEYKGKLAGYQNKAGDFAIKNGIQVFPVHLFNKANPLFSFFYHPFKCEPYAGMLEENRSGCVIKTFFEKYVAQYGKQLETLIGKTPDQIKKDYMLTFSMMDSFISDLQDGRELKKAKEAKIDLEAYNKTAYEFSEIDIMNNWNGDEKGFFARWTCSALFPEVLAWMDNRIAADEAGNKDYSGYKLPRMGIFSTHDVTVGSALTCFNIAFATPKYYTPYACDLFLELHVNKKGKWNVTLKYNGHKLGKWSHHEFKTKLQSILMTEDEISETCKFSKK
jgi:hypothetical protein